MGAGRWPVRRACSASTHSHTRRGPSPRELARASQAQRRNRCANTKRRGRAVPNEARISGQSCWRSASSTSSFTQRATPAITRWTERGWSDQRSPASHDAASMAHAPPDLGRCEPRSSRRRRSGMSAISISGSTAHLPAAIPSCCLRHPAGRRQWGIAGHRERLVLASINPPSPLRPRRHGMSSINVANRQAEGAS